MNWVAAELALIEGVAGDIYATLPMIILLAIFLLLLTLPVRVIFG